MTDDDGVDMRARFRAAYEQHYGSVLRYARRRTDPDTAQEVAAETFLVAWRRWEDVPAHQLPWLYAVARKTLANERRRDRVAQRLVELAAAQPTPPAGAGDHADHVAQTARITEMLRLLPSGDREAMYLIAWEDLTVKDAAAVLGISANALGVRLFRARRRLRRLLADRTASPEDPPVSVRTARPRREEAQL